jgi:hypothetical protein
MTMRRLFSSLVWLTILSVIVVYANHVSGSTAPSLQTDVGEPLLAWADSAEIVQLTPTEGAGAFPLFEWEAVDGAVTYVLLVFDTENGSAYWAWEGEATSIYLGGAEVPLEDASGPVLLRPMSWSVLAFDAEGALVGVSAVRAIAP